MDRYITGAVIKELREKHHFTQSELSDRLGVSDKTVSVTELLSGNAVSNRNVSANMLRSKFTVCGNVIVSTGEAVITCHGVQLLPAEPEKADEAHRMTAERVDAVKLRNS